MTDKCFFDNISKMFVLPPEFSSVHAPISVTLKCVMKSEKVKENLLPPPPKFVWDRNQSPALVNLLRQPESQDKLRNIQNCITHTSDMGTELIDLATKDLSELLFSVAGKCLRLCKKPKLKSRPTKKPWFSDNCLDYKKRLQNLAKLVSKHPTEPYIVGKYNKVKKEYRKLLKETKRQFENNEISKLNQLSNDPKLFWKHLKKITGSNKSLIQNNVISPDVWIEHFSTLNKNNPSDLRESDNSINSIIKSVSEKIRDTHHTAPCHILDNKFSEKEVMDGIRKLKSGKASGCDAISNDIIKVSAVIILPTLCHIFNKLLELGHYPIQWATGLIMPMHKSGEFNDPNNYRGITINSCLSKLFTLLLNERLTHFCDLNATISHNQAGFRRGFRTADQVFTLKTLIDQAFSNGKKLYTCFVDFKKAYDTVWRDGLWYKLLENNISPKFVSLLKDMYSRLQVCIRLPNGISHPFPSLVGLKQGCNLSPNLFNIFVNSLVEDLDIETTNAPKLANLSVNCLLYADDLVIISESAAGLQNSLDILGMFTKKWHMQVNTSKTKCLTFARGRKPTNPPCMKLNGIPIQKCESYCYLGTVFAESGSLNLAAKTLCDKARNAMYALLKNLYKHKACNVFTLIELFDKMVAPIALYNAEVWGTSCIPINPHNISLLDFDKIYKYPVECFQGKFLKRVLGVSDNTSNWAVYSEVGRPPIILKIFTSIIKFLSHLQNTSSQILKSALKVSLDLSQKGYNSWLNSVIKLLNFCNIPYNGQTVEEVSAFANKSKGYLTTKFQELWEIKRVSFQDNSKLELYMSLKQCFGKESYLNMQGFKLRCAITKLRISAHRLPIETGRYLGIPRLDRVCPLCHSGMDNEAHYLLQCPYIQLKAIRDPILNDISQLDPSFNELDIMGKCKYILTREDQQQLAKSGLLCLKIQEEFKDIMKSVDEADTS